MFNIVVCTTFQENCQESFVKIPEKEAESLDNLRDKNNLTDNLNYYNSNKNYTKNKASLHNIFEDIDNV